MRICLMFCLDPHYDMPLRLVCRFKRKYPSDHSQSGPIEHFNVYRRVCHLSSILRSFLAPYSDRSLDFVKFHPFSANRTCSLSLKPFVDAGKVKVVPALGFNFRVLDRVLFQACGTALFLVCFFGGRI
mmetsp:Transcript_5271/g.33127  ORF Transcript_5271/g.33127 Transcript_5271/m.33127 type:complete len:128 (-) Transcript_5271:320-703(-)